MKVANLLPQESVLCGLMLDRAIYPLPSQRFFMLPTDELVGAETAQGMKHGIIRRTDGAAHESVAWPPARPPAKIAGGRNESLLKHAYCSDKSSSKPTSSSSWRWVK